MPAVSCATASAMAAATDGGVGKDSSFEASLIAPGTFRPGAYAGSVSRAVRVRTVIVDLLS